MDAESIAASCQALYSLVLHLSHEIMEACAFRGEVTQWKSLTNPAISSRYKSPCNLVIAEQNSTYVMGL